MFTANVYEHTIIDMTFWPWPVFDNGFRAVILGVLITRQRNVIIDHTAGRKGDAQYVH